MVQVPCWQLVGLLARQHTQTLNTQTSNGKTSANYQRRRWFFKAKSKDHHLVPRQIVFGELWWVFISSTPHHLLSGLTSKPEPAKVVLRIGTKTPTPRLALVSEPGRQTFEKVEDPLLLPLKACKLFNQGEAKHTTYVQATLVLA